MKGDFTRFTFASPKHYDAVLMQQGRVQTDADWNEQVMIAAHRNRTETGDIIGPTGAPQDLALGGKGSFVVFWAPDAQNVNQLFINQGRYYADGLMVESESAVQYTQQPGAALPPTTGGGIYIFYLDVWRRHVTSLEDPGIREVALAGADSGTRSQLVFQIRAQQVGAVGDDINAIPASNFDPPWQPTNTTSTGTMDARAGATPLENQLYRVEIHRGGGPATAASCKWSRDNATVVARVLTHSTPVAAQVTHGNATVTVWQFSIDIDRNGRDSFSSFLPGQMVELSNDAFVLQRKPGVFGTITAVVGDTLTLEVPQASAPLGSGSAIVNPLLGTTPTVRRWDNPWNPDDGTVTLVNVGPDYTTADARVVLERDISVKFATGASDLYRTGDYWLIPARTVSGLVDWEPNVPQHAAGEEHTFAPLALVRVQAGGAIANPAADIVDMRKVFPTLRSLGGSGGGIVTGTGTTNFVPKWQSSATSKLVNSSISDDGTTVAIADQLKVGTAGTAATITRFTSEPISAMPAGTLPATVPTAGGVKTYVEGVVNGTAGRHARFTGAHLLGDSLVSEAGTTVTVQGSLSVNSGNAATSTLNVAGATTLQGTLKVGTAGTAATINRMTSEAIQGLSSTDLPATVPTSQAVKNFMNFSVPPGTVMAFASELIPSGWLECNGASLDGSSATNQALFNAIGKNFGAGNGSPTGFNLPDLRGKFIRGWAHGSGSDPDRAARIPFFFGGQSGDHVGSFQSDQFRLHSHGFTGTGSSGFQTVPHTHNLGFNSFVVTRDNPLADGVDPWIGAGPGFPWFGNGVFQNNTGSASIGHSHAISVSGTIGTTGGNETRPVNVYLTYIIKL